MFCPNSAISDGQSDLPMLLQVTFPGEADAKMEISIQDVFLGRISRISTRRREGLEAKAGRGGNYNASPTTASVDPVDH